MYFKVNFKNKSMGSTSPKKTSDISGVMIFRFKIVNNIPKISNGMLILNKDCQFNVHQQSSWGTDKGYRKSFANKFSLSFSEPTKRLLKMSDVQTDWWNTLFEDNKISLLNISKFLTGNNPTGSQQTKASAEFILSDGKYAEKPFFNFLKVFGTSRNLKSSKISYEHVENAISYDDFLDMASKVNDNFDDLKNSFYSKQKYFYIDEAKEFIGIDLNNSIQRMRAKFRNNLISEYQRRDQFYRVFTARKMVEAAHIKPVSHNASEEEIININNGILLSPDIHKLFDSGAISFNANGKVMYTTNKSREPFNISKKEVNRLELDNYRLNSKLLNKERLDFLNYHRKNVYLKGV